MELNQLVKITRLENVENVKQAMQNGQIFKYKKSEAINYLFHNGKAMRFLTYLEFAPNVDRGNHYHNKKQENMLLIKGELTAKFWRLDKPDEKLTIILQEGDIVSIKPKVAHAYISTNGASAIEYSPQKLNIKDQIKCKKELL